MSEQWHKNYIQLAFRLEAFFHQHYQLPFVGYYYGPSEWKQQVMEECIEKSFPLV